MSKEEITDLLRARNHLLIVQSDDELAAESAIIEASAAAKYECRLWDCASGLSKADGATIDASMVAPMGDLPPGVLDRVRDDKSRAVYILRDFHAFWSSPYVVRTLRTLARALQRAPKNEARVIIILTGSAEVPPELKGQAPRIKWALPTRPEMAKLLDDTIASLPEELRASAAPNGTRAAAIDAAMGLTNRQAADCFALSLVKGRTVVPSLVSAAKKSIIAAGKGLTWEDPDPRGMSAVGGLSNVKAWLTKRRSAFSEKARAYGLTPPKGMFLVGLPGTGKTLVSKCVAAAWGLPLISLDLGLLKEKFVGSSEENMAATLAMLDAIAPCVVRIDEIEKALAGATEDGGGDGGVSKGALGSILSWMSDRKSAVFVIATANDVRALPAELLRKGRFDEVFFVDLPTTDERAAIVGASLAAHGRGAVVVDAAAVARATQGFSGAEIAALVPDALFQAFDDGEREIATEDLLTAAASVVPLSMTAKDKIDNLRAWAKGKARFASPPEVESTSAGGRDLDM